jgi:hypothetical protein
MVLQGLVELAQVRMAIAVGFQTAQSDTVMLAQAGQTGLQGLFAQFQGLVVSTHQGQVER